MMKLFNRLYPIAALTLLYYHATEGAHFFGGTIRGRGVSGRAMRFEWSMGWKIGAGPCGAGCTSSDVGKLKSAITGSWKCSVGCSSAHTLSSIAYTVTGVNTKDNWEQGVNSFSYTFPRDGKYEVSFAGNDWRSLNFGKPSNWNLLTSFYVGSRSDTKINNISPSTKNSPIYKVQYGCKGGSVTRITIPLLDDDGDDIRCRWAAGKECASVCRSLPDATLTNANGSCIIDVDTTTKNYAPNGWYASAIQIEDFPRSSVRVAGLNISPSTPLSSIPLQFLIYTPQLSVSCTAVPVWVSDTPAGAAVLYVTPGSSLALPVFARSPGYPTVTIDLISIYGPAGMTSSPSKGVSSDAKGRKDTKMLTLKWSPGAPQIGSHSICFQAQDTVGKSSEFRCVTIAVSFTTPAPATTTTTTTPTTATTPTTLTPTTTTTTTTTTTLIPTTTTTMSPSTTANPATTGANVTAGFFKVEVSTTMSGGAMGGIVVGLLALLAVLVVLAVLIRKRLRKSVDDAYTPQMPPAPVVLSHRAARSGGGRVSPNTKA